MNRVRRLPALLLAITGTVFFQLGGALSIQLFAYVGAAGAALLRLLIASAIMCSLSRPRWRRLQPRQLLAVVPFGLAIGSMYTCFYEAVDRIPFGSSLSIQFIGPLAVAVLTRRRRLDLLWIALAALGILALVDPEVSAGNDPAGYLFAALGGVAWGSYIVLGKRLGALFPDSSGLAIGMVVACVVPLAPALASLGEMRLSPVVLPLGLAVALLSSVIPHTTDVEALRRLPANVFGIVMSFEPVLALLIGAVLLGQAPEPRQLIGVLAIAIAAFGVIRNQPAVEAGDHP